VSWYSRSVDGFVLAVHVQPGAKRSEVAGLHGDRLKVRIAAPPLEGRANEALIAYLAERFDVPRAKVRVLKGEQSRTKLVAIDNPAVDPEALLRGA